jgi:hypothetical protein
MATIKTTKAETSFPNVDTESIPALSAACVTICPANWPSVVPGSKAKDLRYLVPARIDSLLSLLS